MFDIHGAASGSKDECTNTLPIPARGEKEVRRLLRTKRMPWSCPNKRDAYHRTALHHAAASGNAEVLALLLDFDATPGLKDKAGITPLMMAIRNGHEDAAHLLLEAFAHLDLQDHPVQELTPEGDGPLLLAVKSGYPGMLKLLLRYSEDVDAMDANGWTALHLASRDGKEEMVEFLLLAGANVDGRSAPPLRHTPLHEACYTGQLEVVRTLLVSRAAADLQSGTGDTALHLAAALAGPQAPAIVALLLDAGADPELQNDAGQRPHDLARRSEVRKLLANTSGQAARYHFRNYLYRVQQDTHPRLQAAAPDPGARPGEATASKRKLAGSNAAGTGVRSTQADVLQKKAVAPGPAAPAKKRSAFGPTTSSSGVKAEPGSDLGEAPAPHNDSAAAAPGVESEPAAEAGSRGAAGRGGHTQVVEGLQSMLTQLEGMRSRLSDLEGTIAGTRWQPARSGVGGEERGGGSWGKAAPEPSREGLPLPGTGPPPLCSRPAGPGREEAGVGAATVPFATDDGEAFREALAREEREAQEQLVWECAVLEPEAGRYRRRTQRDLQPAPTRHVVLKDAWSCAKA